jgi:hypothetical protein
VGRVGLEAAVQDADEAVAELAERGVVADAAGAELVVVGAVKDAMPRVELLVSNNSRSAALSQAVVAAEKHDRSLVSVARSTGRT